MQKRVFEHAKIEIIWNSQVEEVLGAQRVEGLKLKQTQPNSTNSTNMTIEVGGVFVAIGHRPDTDLFKGQIELDQKGYVLTSTMYAVNKIKNLIRKVKDDLYKDDGKFDFTYQTTTSLPGVFGAGDCVDHVYKQASTAAGMGVQAALDAERWLESR